MTFSTLADVRSQIDSIDSELVSLIAQRATCVQAAAAFKTDHSAVRAPERVQQVIDRVREKAAAAGLPEVIIEKVYRSMIDAFIEYELEQHNQLQRQKSNGLSRRRPDIPGGGAHLPGLSDPVQYPKRCCYGIQCAVSFFRVESDWPQKESCGCFAISTG